jgi:hypothetical protein
MLFVPPEKNVLAPGVAELHLNAADVITVILPEGDEITIAGDGTVYDNDGDERFKQEVDREEA